MASMASLGHYHIADHNGLLTIDQLKLSSIWSITRKELDRFLSIAEAEVAVKDGNRNLDIDGILGWVHSSSATDTHGPVG